MIEWDWVAAAAVFGLVVCAVVGFWAPRKVSIAERIGGHIVTVPHGRVVGDDWRDDPDARLLSQKIEADSAVHCRQVIQSGVGPAHIDAP